MATGSNSDINGTWHHDVRAHYRMTEHGAHIVVVPTRCPSRLHALTTAGYRIVETGNTLHVSCEACTQLARPDHSWTLATDGQKATSAEFDDGPYAELRTDLARR
jgi:hypothetical protein